MKKCKTVDTKKGVSMATKAFGFCASLTIFLSSINIAWAVDVKTEAVRQIYSPKQVVECMYTYLLITDLIEAEEKSKPTEKGREAIDDSKKKVEKYKSLIEKYFKNPDDLKIVSESVKELRANKGQMKTFGELKINMDRCDSLDAEMANLEIASSIVGGALGIDLEDENLNIGPKVSNSLGPKDMARASTVLSARKSAWSAFKLFFEYTVKDYGLSSRASYYHHKMYYDIKSISKKDSLRKVLTYEEGDDMVVGPLLGEQTKFYNVTLYELNCKNETYRTFDNIKIFHPIQKEKILNVDRMDSKEWAYFSRNTEVSELYEILCE
jgi:hypothetical protein